MSKSQKQQPVPAVRSPFVQVSSRNPETFETECESAGLFGGNTFGVAVDWSPKQGFQRATALMAQGEIADGSQIAGILPQEFQKQGMLQIAAIEGALMNSLDAVESPMVMTIEVVTDASFTAEDIARFITDEQVRLVLENQGVGYLRAQGMVQNAFSSLQPASTLVRGATNRICLIGLYQPSAERGRRLLQILQIEEIQQDTMVRQVVSSGAFHGLELITGTKVMLVTANTVLSALKEAAGKRTNTTVSFGQKRTIARLAKPVAYAGKVGYINDPETGHWTIRQTLTLTADGTLQGNQERTAVELNLRNILKGGNAIEAASYELNNEAATIHIGEADGADTGLNAFFSVNAETGKVTVQYTSESVENQLAVGAGY